MRLSMMQSSKRPLLVIRPLVKAMRATGVLAKAANIPPGARWITLHGDSEGGGQHVLIVPTGDGAYRVAAGAGGKLNHMRLTQVRSQAQYAKDAAEKKAKKKAEQPEDDDETKKAKKAALKDIKDQRKQAKQDFLRVVDEYIGKIYGDKKPGPDDDKADDAPEENEQEKMRNAVATVAKVRKQLVEHIKEGGVHIPGVTVGIDSDELMDIRDLDPTSRERDPTKGARDRVPVPHGEHQGEGEPGSAVGSGAATPGEEGQEAIRVRQESTSEDKGGSLGEVTGTELRQNILLLKVDEFGNPVKPDELDMQAAIDLVKAEKKLRKQQREARKAEKKVRSVETVEQVLAAKSAVVDIHELDANDKDVAEALRNDLTSATALGFLDRLKEHNPDFENYLGNHIADGGYYSINAMTTTVGGVAMVDRAVVDVLGIAGASQVAMRQVMKEHPDRADKLAKAMADYHVSDQVKRTQDAMDKADKALAAAKELEGTHELYDGDDYFYLQELAHERKTELEAADRALGVALGEMEANATIVHTLENGVKDEVQVGMGKMGVDDVAKKLQAIGLDESDYVISDVNATRSAKILASGLDKLARPVDKEALQRQRDAIAITRGDYDEDDWLPEGVADRPDLAIDSEPGVAPQLQQEFQFSGNVTESAHDYIGGRIADGDRPEDVLADLTSDAIIDKVGAKNAKKLSDLADRLRHENPAVMQEHLQTLADKYVQKKFGASRSPLHRQTLPVEHNTVEAAHRAMAESPTAKLAFTPVGELKAADQRTLREWYAANVGHGDSEQGKKLQAQYNELLNNEPSKEAEGTTTRAAPEWVRWRKKVDSVHSKLSKLGVPWSEYAAAHNSTAEAYATVQDLVKSQYVQRFAHHYNRLNPKNPLKIGKAAVRNNMHHLSAIAPDMVSKTNAERGDRFGRLDKETRETLGDSVLNLQGREAGGALRQDERYTLGQAAEGTLAGVAAKVGRQFVAGQPVKLWKASMNGKYVDQQRAIKLIDKNKRVALGLGTGCVHGDTLLTDAQTGETRSFQEWYESGDLPTVWAYDESAKRMVKAQSSDLFIKGVGMMYEVTTADGKRITVTGQHRFLTASGWHHLDDLGVGSQILAASCDSCEQPEKYDACRPPTSSASALPARASGVHHCSGIPQGSQARCSAYPRQCGEQPRPGLGSGPASPRPPAGAREHTRSQPGDDLVCAPGHSRSYPGASRLSMLGSFPSGLTPLVDGVRHAVQASCGWFLRMCQGLSLSRCSSYLDLHTWGGQFRWCPETVGLYSGAYAAPGGSGNTQRTGFSARVHELSGLSSSRPHGKRGQSVDDLKPYLVPITEIRCVGDCIIYDITVPGHANYLAHGLINHNSGKSIIMLGAIAHLKSQGKAKRAIMAVPSIVQGQMNGEALRYLEPGKFKWFADTGASREQRIAALKDPSHDFVVMTHQSLRDDLVHLAAEANGSTPEAEAAKVSAMNKAEAREWMKNTMEHHNINFDAAFYDEAHATLDRAGKADSLMSNVLQGVSDNAEYYAHASADPAKNDSSEVWSLLNKLDPQRFGDRQEFLRRYGSGTNGAAASLRRVLSGYVMAGHIQTGNKVHRKEVKVKVTPEQEKALSTLDTRVAQAKLNSAAGKVDVDLIKQLAPGAFEGKPASQHEDIARHMQKHVSLLHETARKQVLDGKTSAKRDAVVNEIKARQGKPGMVFARSLEAVADMKKRLEQQGLKVATLTGSDSAESKASKGRGFNELGKYDVLVSSDAGAVGLNAQRGQWLIQYDVPQTAMVHAQRNGRVDRLGQQNEVELIDMVADHPVERRARKRLSHKYDLRKIITEPYSALDDTGLGHYLARATQG